MQQLIFFDILLVFVLNLGQSFAFWLGNRPLKCGASSSSKNLLLSSPVTVPSDCSYTVIASNSLVCQIRVDFDLTLAPPSLPTKDNELEFAECVDDVMFLGDFKLCGRDRKQHLYIPVNAKDAARSMEIKFKIANRTNRSKLVQPKWRLRVNQLRCPPAAAASTLAEEVGPLPIMPRTFFNEDYSLVAPTGCAQYYPQPSGVFTSFNFNDGNGVYPGNMHYAICFRRTSMRDKLRLKSLFFQIGELFPAIPSVGHVGELCFSKIPTPGRSEDFLELSEATIIEEGLRTNLFCGNSLQGASVIGSTPGPLVVTFNADTIYHGSEIGFSFTYAVM